MPLLTNNARNLLLGAGSTLCIHADCFAARVHTPARLRFGHTVPALSDTQKLRGDFIVISGDIKRAYEQEVVRSQSEVAQAGEQQ